jgi:hypothetical protein
MLNISLIKMFSLISAIDKTHAMNTLLERVEQYIEGVCELHTL